MRKELLIECCQNLHKFIPKKGCTTKRKGRFLLEILQVKTKVQTIVSPYLLELSNLNDRFSKN